MKGHSIQSKTNGYLMIVALDICASFLQSSSFFLVYLISEFLFLSIPDLRQALTGFAIFIYISDQMLTSREYDSNSFKSDMFAHTGKDGMCFNLKAVL